MNMHAILLFSFAAFAAASFEICGTPAVTVSELVADPPERVAANQPVTMRIRFTVPQGAWIPDGQLRLATSVNYVPVGTFEDQLCKYVQCPVRAGEHTIVMTENFPKLVWGRVVADAVATNSSGAPLLCARWRVWATGTDTNETKSSWF